jgi:hypothetical protein
MWKRMVYVSLALLVLGSVDATNAGDVLWTGLGADNLWSNSANWEGNKVPTAADDAKVDLPGAAAPNGPVIQDGIDAVCSVLYNDVVGEPTLTMTGGTLTISGWGVWWGDGPGCHAKWHISGGTVDFTGSPGILEFGWGGGSGTVIVTGGTVNAKGALLPAIDGSGFAAALYLHGGTFNIGTARGNRSDHFGGGLVVQDNGLIDITEGTLVLEVLEGKEDTYMQYIEDLIAAGQITAYGGPGELKVDYDVRNPGKITVTAVKVERAYNPDPPDGTYHPETSATLSWTAADTATSHNIYFGDSLSDVTNGTGGTFQRNQAETFFAVGVPESPCPEGLVPGTTYYWRIEELGPGGTMLYTGDVWSFTVPPRTAYNPAPANGAESVDPSVELAWTEGFDAVLHTVYFGDDFHQVSSAIDGLPQPDTTFTPPTPLESEKVYYWRVDEFDVSGDTHTGSVWAFSTPGAVGNPNPANGATGVETTAVLSWTAGASATSHDVYFGTNQDAVRNATRGSPEYRANRPLGSESYDPGLLAWHTDYYWRVDEVANPAKTGCVWKFTTADFLVVDDFEDYNDYAPDRVFDTWENYSVNNTGATVGKLTPPFAEQRRSKVHAGSQSMPYKYDNDGAVNEGTEYEQTGTKYYSEAEREYQVPQDWTREGVGVLSLWFCGSPGNASEPLYVVLQDSDGMSWTVPHPDPAAATIDKWHEWSIALTDFVGVNPKAIRKISIRVGDVTSSQPGGSGRLWFDDIRLY